jgi:hypothetical protein
MLFIGQNAIVSVSPIDRQDVGNLLTVGAPSLQIPPACIR